MWTNPFLSRAEPRLAPWASPGRMSVAPTPSADDLLTWDEATFYARFPQWPRGWRGELLRRLVERDAAFWQIPDDPFGSLDWVQRQRLRPFIDYTRHVNDPALRLRVCR